MYAMVKQGELNHLVGERTWQEWQRSLLERNPEEFINVLRASGALQVILPELDALFGIPNGLAFHPEVDTGIHTLMVLQAAVMLSDDPLIRFGALMHDLGKATTPMTEWPKHPGHEARGIKIIDKLAQRLRIPTDYRTFALLVAQFHGLIHKSSVLGAEAIVDVLEQSDAFRRKQRFEHLLLACEADAKGTGRKMDYKQSDQWRRYQDACDMIKTETFVAQGLEGQAIKLALRKKRIECIQEILETL
jgi:tRNA nucleotidyltransferase (CCA-adding enzyme)